MWSVGYLKLKAGMEEFKLKFHSNLLFYRLFIYILKAFKYLLKYKVKFILFN